jgi:capsule biosynthesis phosphatase
MKRLVFDLDGTLTHDDPALSYADKRPRTEIVQKLREYHAAGFTIIIASSRNMRTHQSSVGLINAKTLPTMFEWLAKHDIPYDEIHIGKPWCGMEGFYIDDKAVRPSELQSMSYDEIVAMLEREKEAVAG